LFRDSGPSAQYGSILDSHDQILITGSSGFIGSKVIETLLNYGFTNLRCLVRPSSNVTALEKNIGAYNGAVIDIVTGNLQSRDDCRRIVQGVSVIYHLAAGTGEKSYPDAYLNSVITTRNLLEEVLQTKTLKRFVNVSSFTVYAISKIPSGGLLDESCRLEDHPHLTGEAYCYAKVRQDELVMEYARKYGLPYVIMRPGVAYGPGKKGITGRIGIGTFGIFLHLGGANTIPLAYVDNCADAIAMAGFRKGIDGEVFNVVDDDLPASKKFLRMYKENVGHFRSLYVPHALSYLLCYLWEKYSEWSEGQLPPAFNRKRWSSYWKGNRYSNEKTKKMLGWKPKVGLEEAAMRYFEYQKVEGRQK
jgi:nucleoside-diphosphate-sugar epimerase